MTINPLPIIVGIMIATYTEYQTI